MARSSTSFQKGDPRINRKGRPQDFTALRSLAQAIAHEEATSKGEPVIINGKKASVTEVILRQWAQSKDPRLQMHFVEVAYGKTPLTVEGAGEDKAILIRVVYVNGQATEPA